MKVALVTPFYNQQRGNTVTVQRISRGLNRLGVETMIISSTEEMDLPRFPPVDIVHGFNAFMFNRYWQRMDCFSNPCVVTLTGTDLNHNLFDKYKRDEVIQSLNGANAIHVFNKEAKNKLWHEIPMVKRKTYIIPQGVDDFPLVESKVEKEKGAFLFLLPAGIRKVKNILAAISMLSSLHDKDPSIHLWIVGAIIEEEEGKKVQELVEKNKDWIRYLGQVPHREMGTIYQCADVVLNTSISEGQSSAILEAMAQEIPVIASDNTGNRDIISHSRNGFIYHSEQEFIHYAQRLIQDGDLRRQMGSIGKKHVKKYHSTEKEAQDLLSIYNNVLGHNSKVDDSWRKKEII